MLRAQSCPHHFYPRPPGGGRPCSRPLRYASTAISIHALRVEGDQLRRCRLRLKIVDFYPRPPGGGRPEGVLPFTAVVNFYPRPPGGGRHRDQRFPSSPFYFYPRPPGGGRPRSRGDMSGGNPFLSTPSGWRATRNKYVTCTTEEYFYPRPPGGGRPKSQRRNGGRQNFYPRPPGGGRHPKSPAKFRLCPPISIHALRVEGDHLRRDPVPRIAIFLSTPSGWRATRNKRQESPSRPFLSTPSGWRATVMLVLQCTLQISFLSTPSGWRATGRWRTSSWTKCISIHALRVEGDRHRDK